MGKRPDRAVIVYCNLIRQKYKHVPIIAGGIEAALRRMAHYDYWSDSLRRSILLESGADLVSYGMGEQVDCCYCRCSGCRYAGKRHYLYCRELSARCALWMRSVTIRCFLTMKASVKIRKNMRRASIFSTAIQIRFLENGWWSLIRRTCVMSCRTRLQNR